MKQFFKFLFASCLGTFLALGLIFFVLFSMGSVLSSQETKVPKDSVLLLEFNSPVPERTGNIEQSPYSFESQSSLGLEHIKRLINHAQTDPNIKGIVYKAGLSTPLGMVTVNEIQDALETFRDSTDKFIYSYGDFYTNKSYMLASASDSIFLNPSGLLEIQGYSAMVPFYKGLMDKLGVEMNIFYAGNYKSATEPYRRKDMSPANKEQIREFLNDNFDLFVQEVVKARGIPQENILELVNTLDFDNLEEALDLGIVDEAVYKYQFDDRIRELSDIKKGKSIKYISLDEYASKTTLRKPRSKNRIAVVYAEGEVMYQTKAKGVISETKFKDIFDKIRRDEKIKAVVLRVNSPGGSAFSSNEIWKEVEELKALGLPVVASFGNYAASGGYYIAAGADKIVSHPQTLTGSIGVYTMFPNFTDLMEDKLGIHYDTVKTNPNAVPLSPFYDLSSQEKDVMSEFTNKLYDKFLGIVADGRDKTKEEIHEVAQGRVWTGQRAVNLGLVDTLGGLQIAIDMAADLAEISGDYKLNEYPKIKKDVWEELLTELMKQQDAKLGLSDLELSVLEEYEDLKSMLKYREPLARLPYKINY